MSRQSTQEYLDYLNKIYSNFDHKNQRNKPFKPLFMPKLVISDCPETNEAVNGNSIYVNHDELK